MACKWNTCISELKCILISNFFVIKANSKKSQRYNLYEVIFKCESMYKCHFHLYFSWNGIRQVNTSLLVSITKSNLFVILFLN